MTPPTGVCDFPAIYQALIWPKPCVISGTNRPARPAAICGSRLRSAVNITYHLTIPLHDSLKIGTLAGILAEVANHLQLSRDEVVAQLFT